MKKILLLAILSGLLVALTSSVCAKDDGWIKLPCDASMNAWQSDSQGWTLAGDVTSDSDNPAALVVKPGEGVLVSSLKGHVEFRNLTSKQTFGDIEAHVEFLLPKGSNAGVKFQGLYEIQIRDSYGIKDPTASDCGGIYPRAELQPTYHLIDEGFSPRSNAALPPGEWQRLEVSFRAPRFDSDGQKTANAKFNNVVLNGRLIHRNIELKWPTGHAWRTKKEFAQGPLFLQGDHGPIAYRNVRVRSISRQKE